MGSNARLGKEYNSGHEGKISTPLGCQQVSLDWKVHCYHHLWYEGCQSSLLGMEEQAMVHVT